MEEWRYNSTILDLGTGWGWVVSFMPWALYPQGESPWYPLYRRLGGSQSQSGCCWEERNVFSSAGNQTHAVQPVVHCCTDWAIPAPSSLYSIVKELITSVTRKELGWLLKLGRSFMKEEIVCSFLDQMCNLHHMWKVLNDDCPDMFLML
jgi:hypothetical protein